ncbi:MAG: PspC domain-containing protein [Chromatiaceae bacterium]
MKGKLLDFSLRENQGVIAGDDGSRFTFTGKEWKSSKAPQAGMKVDFETVGRTAQAVYIEPLPPSGWGEHLVTDAPYLGFYRSSDDKMIEGVCAGLAHKWRVNRGGLRFSAFLSTLFVGILIIVYAGCWMVLPERPTLKED